VLTDSEFHTVGAAKVKERDAIEVSTRGRKDLRVYFFCRNFEDVVASVICAINRIIEVHHYCVNS